MSFSQKYTKLSEGKTYSDLVNGMHIDALIVGSGYGGSIAALRILEQLKEIITHREPIVILLERGKEFLPGEFPATLSAVQKNAQIRTDVAPAVPVNNPVGLFDLRVNQEMSVLVGCGLGGTSLINANVALETAQNVFNNKSWPQQFARAAGPTALASYYSRARGMLGANPYPVDSENYHELNKIKVLKKSADNIGVDISYPPINVNFKGTQDNGHGVAQPACNLCGDCCSGCNTGAKNTTAMNYLPAAKNLGLKIYCQSKITSLEESGVEKDKRTLGRWKINVTDATKDNYNSLKTITADVVVLSAGTLGSTEILQRSSKKLSLSKTLGTRFSGNGDVLGFSYNNYWHDNDDGDSKNFIYRDADTPRYEPVYAIGKGENTIPDKAMPGPCITAAIDLRDSPTETKRLSNNQPVIIEEGAPPGAVASVLAFGYAMSAAQQVNFLKYGTDQAVSRLQDINDLMQGIKNGATVNNDICYTGALSRSIAYLGMGLDSAAGDIKFDATLNHSVVSWPNAGAGKTLAAQTELMEKISNASSGQFIQNPVSLPEMGEKAYTVHPLGGCGMGDDASKGVVNHKCQVFKGDTGSDVFPGLYVMDGSVMPCALGVNPLLTISAVTERACDLMTEDLRQLVQSEKLPLASLPLNQEALNVGCSWEEIKKEIEKYIQKFGGPEPLTAAAVMALYQVLIQLVEKDEHKAAGEPLSDKLNQLWQLNSNAFNGLMAIYGKQFSQKVQFTERMSGYLDENFPVNSEASIENVFDSAAAAGKSKGQSHRLSLISTIKTDDIWELIEQDMTLECDLVGTEINCPWLSNQSVATTHGTVRFFIQDINKAETWHLEYTFFLAENDKGISRITGFKTIANTDALNLWKAMTEINLSFYNDEKSASDPVAIGKAWVSIPDVVRQIVTLKGEFKNKALKKLLLQIEFFASSYGFSVEAIEATLTRYFMTKVMGFSGELLNRVYGGLLAVLDNPIKRERAALYPTGFTPWKYDEYQSKGSKIKLTRVRNRNAKQAVPVILAPGFGVTANSFDTPSVDKNLVSFLLETEKYEVWLFDYRASSHSGFSNEPCNLDQIAQEDWPLAIDFVRNTVKCEQVQIVAHCVGSMTLLMGLLCKAINKSVVRSIVASQLSLHPVTNWLNNMKADTGILQMITNKNVSPIPLKNDCLDMNSRSSLFDKALDTFCYQIPMPEGEACNNPVCRRIFSVYGPSYRHEQLNHETHLMLGDWFGSINAHSFEQLSAILKRGYVLDANGKNTYMSASHILPPDPKKKIDQIPSLALPIAFFSGAKNLEFLPETTQRTYDWLCAHNSESAADYSREVIQDYGHMDFFIGKNAAEKDGIFPKILAALEKYNG